MVAVDQSFIKAFKKAHKDEMDEMSRLKTILEEIKLSKKSKVQYYTQLRFNVE